MSLTNRQTLVVDVCQFELSSKIDINNPNDLYQIARELLKLTRMVKTASINIHRSLEVKLENIILFSPLYDVRMFLQNEELQCHEIDLLSLFGASKFIERYGLEIENFFTEAREALEKSQETLNEFILKEMNEKNDVDFENEIYQRASQDITTLLKLEDTIKEYKNALSELNQNLIDKAKFVEVLRAKILTEALIVKRTCDKKARNKTDPIFPSLKTSIWKNEKAPPKSSSSCGATLTKLPLLKP